MRTGQGDHSKESVNVIIQSVRQAAHRLHISAIALRSFPENIRRSVPEDDCAIVDGICAADLPAILISSPTMENTRAASQMICHMLDNQYWNRRSKYL